MQGKELIIKAFKRQRVERIPWVPFVGCHAAQLTGKKAGEYLLKLDERSKTSYQEELNTCSEIIKFEMVRDDRVSIKKEHFLTTFLLLIRMRRQKCNARPVEGFLKCLRPSF